MNYWEYIHVEELLALQGGFDADESKVGNDEALFIVVHQVYELWFKLILRELTTARDILRQNPVPDIQLAAATRSFKRVITIFEQATQHFQVMETLTTRDYLEFRDRLIPASGFQSAQMREIEIILGLDDGVRIPLGREGSYKEALRGVDGKPSSATHRVEARIAGGPSLKAVVSDWLSRTPIDGFATQEAADAFIERIILAHRGEITRRLALAQQQALTPDDIERLAGRYEKEITAAAAFLRGQDEPVTVAVTDPSKPAAALPPPLDDEARAYLRRVRAAIVFLESYRELPRLTWPREVVDSLVEMEQRMLIWRQRHARMVERVIGRRTGTGGSAGVDYLDQTALRYRVFSDVWAVRSLLLRKATLPPLEHEEAYGFRIED
jgi:tryptophan 2,3-dioxygenase